ncbi:stage II sporulation protein M [Roseovarius sp. SCSIO 43702]|uniref:stage II sporulation protein M n=1 Tax=Roseovarius sp. SCSIO 43702 TaxID=2823043 RepID=UPI001C732AC7|nr:stage II sporulation protein M [Roseovarius sp. SCSIO 43702]QYX55720.1 stage II sporulation protein M [Roseovarius sp. SCSIO 43702]
MTAEARITPGDDAIRSTRFRKEREAGWKKLDALVTQAEKRGVQGMSYEDTLALASLYRQAMNSLSVARAISMDRALLAYLEALCARAYLVVYAPQESVTGVLGRLFTHGIPQAVRRCGTALFIGFLAMILGAFTGYMLYLQDPAWFFTFVPGELADGRTPSASTSYLRSTLFDDDRHSGESLGVFASFLFSHNTQVAILTFTLGIFVTLPSFILTYYNGLILGAFFAMFAQAGLGYELFGWLSIHGVTELSAICVACAGGAQLGLAVLLPGNRTRRAALRERGRDAVKLMVLAGLMLIVAAFVEGFLRQTVQSTELRLAIGWGLGLGWIAWLLLSGREETAR